MVYEDPVIYDWAHIQAPTMELGGEKDGASPNFAERAKEACRTIPKCELVLLPGLGHVPHFEAPELFHKTLVKFLKQ
jgi:pimeloyl-ACP methyl ester carboxylesterase